MDKYPELSVRCLWTLVDPEVYSEDIMSIENFHLQKKEYSEETYNDILEQAKTYNIVSEDHVDSDYDNRKDITLSKPSPECIVVKNNSFAGIFTLCLHNLEAYMHHDSTGSASHRGILFADGNSVGVNYDEFRRCPGYWVFTKTYSLQKEEN